jgi:mono/diheme cytochrome c family protein
MTFLRSRYVGLVWLVAIQVQAAELGLNLDQINRDLGSGIVEITVLEPHMKCGKADCLVTYVGVPLGKLMQFYFPDTWSDFNGFIHFFTSDGYLSSVGAEKVRKQDAYLTFARADGKSFRIDNNQQNEKDLPLGPFYLVWDNLRDRELQKRGSYGWPYQVERIALLPGSVYDSLLPGNASPAAREGFAAWKTYCMGCHQIDGIGGMKYPVNLRELVKGKSRDELRAWISCPGSVRPETNMPPLNTRLGKQERSQVIERIIDYLETL